MRYTQKRNGVNEIPLLNAVCGIDMPYWRIDRADELHSYLSGDAADKLAAYEDAEERGRLVARDMQGRPHYDRPQTNADRIRAMTDEGLAYAIYNDFEDCPWCHTEITLEGYMDCHRADCYVCVLTWLKQEVEE